MNRFDCKTCGACCVNLFIEVSEIDNTPEHLTDVIPANPNYVCEGTSIVMKFKPGKERRCVALRGVVGKSAFCSIYDDRPKTCREFDAGGRGCLEVRKEQGIKDDHETT
jgi:hypothetical protein